MTFSAQDFELGIYIDFEGTVEDPPVLLGLMFSRNGDDYFEQLVFDPRLKSAAEAKAPDGTKDRHCIYVPSLEDALARVLNYSKTYERKIFAWSTREQKVIADSNLDHISKSELAVVNALGIARKWARKHFNVSKLPRTKRSSKYALSNFSNFLGFTVPKAFGPGNSASRLRYVQGQISKRGEFQNLTGVTKAKWTKFLKHNKYDLILTKKVMSRISEEIPSNKGHAKSFGVRQKKLIKNLPAKSGSPTHNQNDTGTAESYIYWSNLAKWSRKKGLFEPWERRLCYLIGRRLLRKDDLTEGMIRHRDRIIAEATRSGFEG